ncbi:MAG: hypothetical protein SNJ82_07015 [Gemmataceae bacterium]
MRGISIFSQRFFGSFALVLLLALVAYGQKITLPAENVKTGAGTIEASGTIEDVDLAIYDIETVRFHAFRRDGTAPGQSFLVKGANLNIAPLSKMPPQPGTWKAKLGDLAPGEYDVYAYMLLKNKNTNVKFEYNSKALPPKFVKPK